MIPEAFNVLTPNLTTIVKENKTKVFSQFMVSCEDKTCRHKNLDMIKKSNINGGGGCEGVMR